MTDKTFFNLGEHSIMEQSLSDLDGGFEPQTRARSNTWPLPRPENFVEITDEPPGMKCPGVVGTTVGSVPACNPETGTLIPGIQMPSATKKNSSRRNAWGNLSYADLITQAITSAPEKRLTLSQIYEWMVLNVPYFKDKGDSNSSAGWKNSIRHNLSLHNRFMRVQNEGTGKSSWWMINPDAKPGKSARRRATSMETSKFEKRRGRVKKKVDALRNGLVVAPDTTPSPSSSLSEGLDLFPDSPMHGPSSFQLSPDFRPRASSNASSCGRLSPIPSISGVENNWSSHSSFPSGYSPEQLSVNLAESMKLQQTDAFLQTYNSGNTTSQQQQQQQQQQQSPQPPPYQPHFEHNFGSTLLQRELNSLHATSPYGISECHIHRMAPCSCHLQQNSPAGERVSPSYPQSEPSPDPMGGQQHFVTPSHALPAQSVGEEDSEGGSPEPETETPSTMMGQLMGALNNSAILDDLNLNIETLHGFDCNVDVDEVIKHELSMEGTLDFNFAQQNHHNQQENSTTDTIQEHQQVASQQSYSTTMSTGQSWVH